MKLFVSRTFFIAMKNYYVYIIRCSDGTYYTGMTSQLEIRINQHIEGKYTDSYTYSRRPLEFVFYTEFREVQDAISWEKRIKKWSVAKKEALIYNEYEKLPNLAKKKFK